MNIGDLHKELMDRNYKNFYIFTGDEVYMMDIYIKRIEEISNKKIMRVSCVEDILPSLSKTSFLGISKFYVIRDDKTCKDLDKLEKILKLLGKNGLILEYSTIDKRGKMWGNYKDEITSFDHLPNTSLVEYIQKFIDLSTTSCEDLIGRCSNDLSRIMLEVDKVKHYADAINIDYTKAYFKLVQDDVIYTEPQDEIFPLIDAILKRKVRLTYNLLEHCRGVGESDLVILQNLFISTRQLLQVQGYNGISKNMKDMENSLGLTSTQINSAKSKLGNYSNGELVYILNLIRNIENGIKTGRINSEIAIDYLLVCIL